MKNYVELQAIMDEKEDLFEGLVASGGYRFRVWLAANMKIYNYFVRFAQELKASRSREHYSARAIWERVRWETDVKEASKGGPVFKINNNYAPFMARLAMVAEPEFEGMFQKRGVRS